MRKELCSFVCYFCLALPSFAQTGSVGNVEVAKVCGFVRDFILESSAIVASSQGGNDLSYYEQKFVKAYESIYLFDIVQGNNAQAVLDDPLNGFDRLDGELRICLEAGACDEKIQGAWATKLAMDLHDACKIDFRGTN